MAPTLFAVVTVLLVAPRWAAAGARARVVSLALVALLGVPALVHRTIGARLMLAEPSEAHEFADNRAIAHALAAIPLRGSVIATNDLRYPADAWARDLRQFQIPAVYGHQAFAVPGYERYPGWQERVSLQRELQNEVMDADLIERLSRQGVTHVLLHEAAPGPTRPPLPLVHDGPEYRVYTIPAESPAGLAASPVRR